jgi:ribosomal-protein-alanine N-acetyltransferase
MDAADLSVVTKIEKETFPVPFSGSLFLKFMDQDAFYCWVVLSGNEVIGYLIYSCAADEIDILNIAVSSKMRGKGVGNTLMGYLYQHAGELGGERIFLEVRPSNEEAIKFYEHLGFVKVGVRPGYYHDSGEDALVYSKDIEVQDH